MTATYGKNLLSGRPGYTGYSYIIQYGDLQPEGTFIIEGDDSKKKNIKAIQTITLSLIHI